MDQKSLGSSTFVSPDESIEVAITFEKGRPVALDGEAMESMDELFDLRAADNVGSGLAANAGRIDELRRRVDEAMAEGVDENAQIKARIDEYQKRFANPFVAATNLATEVTNEFALSVGSRETEAHSLPSFARDAQALTIGCQPP